MSDAYEQFQYLLNETEPCRVPFDEEGKVNDPEKWVGNWVNSTSVEVARSLCAGCHVLAECKAYALANEERDFIWGGTTPAERREIFDGVGQPTTEEPDPGFVDDEETPRHST